ncbi:ribonuclease E/G [Tropicimonas isoalkanivorans]|uniref:Ribonuclease, Rne/Rng family n=1 Tax=Tropicimonas isoalkanivorans TaxID=441112 RepID=A0A1I1MNA7_9RHOB|nr:ribonuclease E/G [Tropicimonas isoalkanivorans]SFC86322.1 ribonuclease, Rne/Rng family [Tropicimonas isoalkanivorans]
MKGTSVFLDHIAGRRAAAYRRDGILEDFLIDPAGDGPLRPGSICRAIVERPMKGQGGVFVRLHDGKGYLRAPKGLREGQAVLVQVSAYAEPGKAVPVTSKLLFKSKYAIVTPDAPGLNISRQIRDEEVRVRLRSIAVDVMDASPFGLILRSQAATAPEDEIAEDIAEMRSLAEAVTAPADGPAELLLEGPDAHALAWREWGDPDEVVTEAGCFETRGVLDDLSAALSFAVALPGGGSVTVEPTRALVAVDVNTGADSSFAAGLKANVETARALPRLLRLRGLGGQIAIDFAPMTKKDRLQVEQALRAGFRSDPVETTLAGWTPLGHFEAHRKRERLPLDRTVSESLQ